MDVVWPSSGGGDAGNHRHQEHAQSFEIRYIEIVQLSVSALHKNPKI